MKVKCMVAHSPSNGAFFARGGGLIGLAFDAQIHDVIPANSAIVDDNVPSPQSDGVPLFHFESLAIGAAGAGRHLLIRIHFHDDLL